MLAQDLGHLGHVGLHLVVQGLRIVGGGPFEALELHPVLLHEGLLGGPVLGAVGLVRRPVAGVVVLAVLAALACAHPGDARAVLLVLAAGHAEQGAGDVGPVTAVLGSVHAEAVGAEPVVGGAGDHGARREGVDAEVVPVEQVVEVRQAQSPGTALGLVVGTGGVAALALVGEDVHLIHARPLQGHGDTRGRWRAVAARARVRLEEQRLALHLGVAGQPAAAAEGEQVLPDELTLLGARDGVLLVAGLFEQVAQRLVVDGQRAIDQRGAVAGHEHEAVAEGQFGPADVPAHGAAQGERDEAVHLRAAAPRVPALPVVQHHVDVLVDAVLDHFPVRVVGLLLADQGLQIGSGGGAHGAPRWFRVRRSGPEVVPSQRKRPLGPLVRARNAHASEVCHRAWGAATPPGCVFA